MRFVTLTSLLFALFGGLHIKGTESRGVLAKSTWNGLFGSDDDLMGDDSGPSIQGLGLSTGSTLMLQQLRELLSRPGLMAKLYQNYRSRFPRNDENSAFRSQVLANNLYEIASHNIKFEAGLESWQMGVNQFSDWTSSELATLTSGPALTSNMSMSDAYDASSLSQEEAQSKAAPASFDWRTRKVIGPAKSQGQCGSCGIFATVATVEAHLGIKQGGKILDLSEQEILDCRYKDCGGQIMDEPLGYMRDTGVTTEKEYPYNDPAKRNSQCSAAGKSHAAKIVSFVRTHKMPEDTIRDTVGTDGPVAIQLMINDEWYKYKKGLYTGGCGNNSGHHALSIVGYGATSDGKPFWILKNSWDVTWGEKGFMLLPRGVNKCNIADWVYTVKV